MQGYLTELNTRLYKLVCLSRSEALIIWERANDITPKKKRNCRNKFKHKKRRFTNRHEPPMEYDSTISLQPDSHNSTTQDRMTWPHQSLNRNTSYEHFIPRCIVLITSSYLHSGWWSSFIPVYGNGLNFFSFFTGLSSFL